MMKSAKIEINSESLQARIEELSLISENPPPVVTRILFSEADACGRKYVKSLAESCGLAVRQDAAGNIFLRWAGSQPDLTPVGTGSHIDAIPNAGKFDGVVGVLGAIEAICSLQRIGYKPRRSIEIIVFTAEEPTRFGIGCIGSRLLAGNLSSEKTLMLKDRDGVTFQEWRRKADWSQEGLESVRLPKNCYSAFVELHIEQGPILEREKVQIGIVQKIAAPSTMRLDLVGTGGHAGGVLMPDRRDALLAGAEIALSVEKAALTSGSLDTVATTGIFQIEPGAVNSVPCRAHLEIDLRDTQTETRDAALAQIEQLVSEICQRRGVTCKLERVAIDPPVICDSTLVETVSGICSDLGFSSRPMVSRAYHDSSFMAQLCPTVMIFIPCRNGVSHRPDEYASPEQIKAGVMVLTQTLAKLAG